MATLLTAVHFVT